MSTTKAFGGDTVWPWKFINIKLIHCIDKQRLQFLIFSSRFLTKLWVNFYFIDKDDDEYNLYEEIEDEVEDEVEVEVEVEDEDEDECWW